MDSKAFNRRTAIGAALVAASPLLFPGRVRAQGKDDDEDECTDDDAFVVLLKGLYQPVVHGPDLGLSSVELSDGSYSTTKIYPVIGTPGTKNPNEAIGDFYVQFEGDLCAYDMRGGPLAMRFTGSDFIFVDDGAGGRFLLGSFELDVIEGRGENRSFVGGHNHMEDKLHFLASGAVDEYCFCFVSDS